MKHKKSLKQRTLEAARTIGKMSALVHDSDPWKNLERRQALRDALEALKVNGVISGYNLETGEIYES